MKSASYLQMVIGRRAVGGSLEILFPGVIPHFLPAARGGSRVFRIDRNKFEDPTLAGKMIGLFTPLPNRKKKL